VLLQWNDTFGSSTNDYDLLLADNNAGTFTPVATTRQSGTGHDPVEQFSFTNSSGSEDLYGLAIGNYKGLAAARTFDMYLEGCGTCLFFPTGLPAPDNLSQHNFNTLSHSVPGESDANGGVISVGAIAAANPGNNTIEFYS